MSVHGQPSKQTSKMTIVFWAFFGAVCGWLVAARLFLMGFPEVVCVIASQGAMLAASLYASRRNLDYCNRILIVIPMGAILTSFFLPPHYSERTYDRSSFLFRGFGTGQFSAVPWSLAVALIFLCASLALSPQSVSENNSGRSGS